VQGVGIGGSRVDEVEEAIGHPTHGEEAIGHPTHGGDDDSRSGPLLLDERGNVTDAIRIGEARTTKLVDAPTAGACCFGFHALRGRGGTVSVPLRKVGLTAPTVCPLSARLIP